MSSGALPKTWFFEVPSDWTAPDGPEQMEALLKQIFTDANARLHQAEPSDCDFTILVLLRQAQAGLLDRQAFVDKGIALRGLAPEAAGEIYDRRDHYVTLLTG